ncbi:MAG: peptidase domain-containing ABC transporter, partial [Deltaproteobacteria bacterium]|nr:peptidase domain-containing ABC transporter [Deltaproteobacteria bacterium]
MRRRVPVLLQMSTTECGAACLAMVLSYYGRATTVSECHDLCGAGRDGATARSIAVAARGLGLKVGAYRAEPPALRTIDLPAIVHVGFNHFVVLERVSARHVDVVDPTGGRARLSWADLDEQFTGVLLTFSTTEAFETRAPTTASRVGRYALSALSAEGVRRGLGNVLGATFVQHLAGLCVPAFTALLFDRFIPDGALSAMDTAMLGLTLIVLGQVVLAYVRGAVMAHVQARLDAHLMLGFFGHLLSLPLRYFEERTSGDLLMRMASNTAVRDIVGTNLLSGVLDALFMAGYFGLLLWLSPWLGLVTLAAAGAQAVLLLLAHRSTQGLIAHELAAQAASQGYLIEALKGVRTLKASGGASHALHHWSGLFFRATRVSQRRNQRISGLDACLLGVRVFAPLSLLWVGGHLAVAGALSIGAMWAVIGVAASALAPTASLVGSAQKWMMARAELERIAEALGTDPEQHGRTVHEAAPLQGAIELRDVRFRYAAASPWAVDGVSLAVRPGEKIAIVGRSGSGKSTLVSLLLGLYEPQRGAILYDTKPLTSVRYDSVRAQLGVVTQDAFVFSGSIRDNISFADPTLTPEDVVRAATLAALHDDIVQMPMGYETLVGEGGIALSGGQRQRMSIARAVARRPAVLVLDEATSQLDTATEAETTAAIRELGCTCIIVAHRLSTVRDADQIFVMDRGQ